MKTDTIAVLNPWIEINSKIGKNEAPKPPEATFLLDLSTHWEKITFLVALFVATCNGLAILNQLLILFFKQKL